MAVRVLEYAPAFLLNNPRRPSLGILAVHQDWSALIGADNPAQPGEVIHAYASGLGPTIPAVNYGQPAPSSEPFAHLRVNYTCVDDLNNPVSVLYEGLAPGLIGIYQIDLRLPTRPRSGDFGVHCSGLGSSFNGRILLNAKDLRRRPLPNRHLRAAS